MRSHCIFISLNLSKLPLPKHVPIAFCQKKNNLSKHVPVTKYRFVSLLTALIISVIVMRYVLVFLGGLQVPKKAEIDQEIAFLFTEHKPLLKPCSHRFWHDYNLSKHVPVVFAPFLQWERVLTN